MSSPPLLGMCHDPFSDSWNTQNSRS
jgi:hypothetical protein